MKTLMLDMYLLKLKLNKFEYCTNVVSELMLLLKGFSTFIKLYNCLYYEL